MSQTLESEQPQQTASKPTAAKISWVNQNLRVGFPGMPPPAPPRPNGRPVTYADMQKSRLAWDALRKSLQSQLQELEETILDAVQQNNEDPKAQEKFDPKQVSEATKQLYKIMDNLDQRLIDTLDKALNAQAGPDRVALQKMARGQIDEYRKFVDSDPMIASIDKNGFMPTAIKPAVDRTLKVLAEAL